MKEEKLTNTIKSITIDGLFEIFDYKIEYPTSDNVLIVTGPNGFGKTQVLNIIFNLFNRNFLYFNKLVFDEIVIVLSNNFSITIDKKSNLQSEIEFEPKDDHLVHEKNRELKFIFRENENEIETFNYSINISNNLIKQIDHFLPVARVGPDQWVDHRTDQIFNLEEVIRKYSNELPGEISKNILKIEHDRTIQILNSIDVHLIKEQRLFKKIANRDKHYRSDRDRSIMIETIQTYASELTKLISEKSQQSYIVTQALDSTYPNRLVSEKNKISKEEYDERFARLTDKQKKLSANSLYDTKQNVLSYSEDDAKALMVYLNDLEQKLSVFDGLLEKLELFTGILNERRFTYKSISINREKGFFFKTSKGKPLELTDLSSGEQHEVVLLYELIFKTKPGILVLIDEPEISLHITWQKEFLDDLLKIIDLQKFQVLIATHSPSIINDRWDLVYNLEKKD